MNRALEVFTAVPRQHNCAQAVVSGLGRDDLKEAMGACGGGHAPGGLCGALHAAMTLVPAHAEEIRKEFSSTLGAETCRALKGELRVPCPRCVETAAALAEKYLS
ncbi:MAG: C_GCAxxG_C_C family protein [Victivallales bacterium]|nr:C_GCAxxG_C_C family protein [Victivallales bacterium]